MGPSFCPVADSCVSAGNPARNDIPRNLGCRRTRGIEGSPCAALYGPAISASQAPPRQFDGPGVLRWRGAPGSGTPHRHAQGQDRAVTRSNGRERIFEGSTANHPIQPAKMPLADAPRGAPVVEIEGCQPAGSRSLWLGCRCSVTVGRRCLAFGLTEREQFSFSALR